MKSLVESGTSVDIEDDDGVSTLCDESRLLQLRIASFPVVQSIISIIHLFCCCMKEETANFKALIFCYYPQSLQFNCPVSEKDGYHFQL